MREFPKLFWRLHYCCPGHRSPHSSSSSSRSSSAITINISLWSGHPQCIWMWWRNIRVRGCVLFINQGNMLSERGMLGGGGPAPLVVCVTDWQAMPEVKWFGGGSQSKIRIKYKLRKYPRSTHRYGKTLSRIRLIKVRINSKVGQ